MPRWVPSESLEKFLLEVNLYNTIEKQNKILIRGRRPRRSFWNPNCNRIGGGRGTQQQQWVHWNLKHLKMQMCSASSKIMMKAFTYIWFDGSWRQHLMVDLLSKCLAKADFTPRVAKMWRGLGSWHCCPGGKLVPTTDFKSFWQCKHKVWCKVHCIDWRSV